MTHSLIHHLPQKKSKKANKLEIFCTSESLLVHKRLVCANWMSTFRIPTMWPVHQYYIVLNTQTQHENQLNFLNSVVKIACWYHKMCLYSQYVRIFFVSSSGWYKFGDYFAKYMNLKEIFCRQTVYTWKFLPISNLEKNAMGWVTKWTFKSCSYSPTLCTCTNISRTTDPKLDMFFFHHRICSSRCKHSA